MAIRNADGTVISIQNTAKSEQPVEMEEIIVNENPIRLENEADDETHVEEAARVIKKPVGVEAPWYRFYKIIYNLFAKDESVTVESSDEVKGIFTIDISCANPLKLAAIRQVFGDERTMGNIKVLITYTEPKVERSLTLEEFALAFKDTGLLVDVKEAPLPDGELASFPIMVKDVIQFYNDNINDYYGNLTLTVADAVREVMDMKNVPTFFFVSTDIGADKPADNEE